MIVITWNIQWGRGVDGRVDLPRIVDIVKRWAPFDVLCLQEVADNYPGLQGLAAGVNQFAELGRLLPDYHPAEGVAVERWTPGVGRQRFGNMILSRNAPLQVLRHLLPRPPDALNHSMPRMVLEAVLDTPSGPLRVMTTHLEYYAAVQRAAHIDALRHLQEEAAVHASPAAGKEGNPFEPRPRGPRAILTGDFNCDASGPEIAKLQAPLAGAPRWVDAWTCAHPGQPHAKTVGLYDHEQWQHKASSFDFCFVTEDLAPRVRRLEVDLQTQASDHQPVLLEVDLTR
ncbi:endonuclease [Ramlibacter henchirensis]|uniref:Endonuclease n=1 Tax=Ramlibacter henchirensis TaxID=204072 RepID=A0A4Z0BN48_9BURK|nr:endonuclease/exonuclease/phosphatase family protein [Ramlibacter henchirensis]TFY99378.1 endonuclease [Ramlibacter henchirensis]